MRTEFLDKFGKDLDKIPVKSVKRSAEKLILNIESVPSLSFIPGIKKLSGFQSAYRNPGPTAR